MAQAKETEGKMAAEGKPVAVRKGSESKALSPFQEVEDMMERMEHMFEEFFPGRRRWGGGRLPRSFEDMRRMFEDVSPRAWLRPREWPSWGQLALFEGRTP